MKLSTVFLFLLLLSSQSFAADLWLQERDALELRSTGNVQSLCSDLINSPETVIMNVRLIDENGDTYMYAPSVGIKPELKIGTALPGGKFVVSKDYVEKFNNAKITLTIKDDTLTFNFDFKDATAKMPYLKSTELEVAEYYRAQDRCKN